MCEYDTLRKYLLIDDLCKYNTLGLCSKNDCSGKSQYYKDNTKCPQIINNIIDSIKNEQTLTLFRSLSEDEQLFFDSQLEDLKRGKFTSVSLSKTIRDILDGILSPIRNSLAKKPDGWESRSNNIKNCDKLFSYSLSPIVPLIKYCWYSKNHALLILKNSRVNTLDVKFATGERYKFSAKELLSCEHLFAWKNCPPIEDYIYINEWPFIAQKSSMTDRAMDYEERLNQYTTELDCFICNKCKTVLSLKTLLFEFFSNYYKAHKIECNKTKIENFFKNEKLHLLKDVFVCMGEKIPLKKDLYIYFRSLGIFASSFICGVDSFQTAEDMLLCYSNFLKTHAASLKNLLYLYAKNLKQNSSESCGMMQSEYLDYYKLNLLPNAIKTFRFSEIEGFTLDISALKLETGNTKILLNAFYKTCSHHQTEIYPHASPWKDKEVVSTIGPQQFIVDKTCYHIIKGNKNYFYTTVLAVCKILVCNIELWNRYTQIPPNMCDYLNNFIKETLNYHCDPTTKVAIEEILLHIEENYYAEFKVLNMVIASQKKDEVLKKKYKNFSIIEYWTNDKTTYFNTEWNEITSVKRLEEFLLWINICICPNVEHSLTDNLLSNFIVASLVK